MDHRCWPRMSEASRGLPTNFVPISSTALPRLWTTTETLWTGTRSPMSTPNTGVAFALRRPACPPERRSFVPSHFRRLDKPVAAEFLRTETPPPDLRPEGVRGDAETRRSFLERQERHWFVSNCIVSQLR